jgi:hypothetical protein
MAALQGGYHPGPGDPRHRADGDRLSMIDHIQTFGARGDGTTANRAPRSRAQSRRRRSFRHLPWRGRRHLDADRDSVGDPKARSLAPTRPGGTATAAAIRSTRGAGPMIWRSNLAESESLVARDEEIREARRLEDDQDPCGCALDGEAMREVLGQAASQPTRSSRASASPRHRPWRPATRSRLAGRSSTPWAPGSFTTAAGTRQVVVDARTGEIPGAHMVGNRACDLITKGRDDGARGRLSAARAERPPTSDVSAAILDAARAIGAIHA